MKIILSTVLATSYGLCMRVVFGFLGDFMGVMSLSFLVLVPAIVGFVTVLIDTRKRRASALRAFFLPTVTCFFILIITMAVNLEGSICWIMIFPFFAVIAGIGGLIANYSRNPAKRNEWDDFENENGEDNNINNGGTKNTLQLSFLLLLPVLLGFAEGDRTNSVQELTISKEIVIAAPPSRVWKELANINGSSQVKNNWSFSGFLGMPRHLRTESDSLALGGHRNAIFEKGLVFNETVTQCIPGRLMVLSVYTDPKKIPPTVLDEHIVIGGKHINVIQDVYKVDSLPAGGSRLKLSSRFTINTPFNWYAGIWAHFLIKDILQNELDYIKTAVSGS